MAYQRHNGAMNDVMVVRARELRREATPAEKRLWGLVRNRQCGGHRFLRQVPAGRFILDFYCASARLAIEVDGGVHDLPEVSERDAERVLLLESELKITVRRLANTQVMEWEESRLETWILTAVAEAAATLPAAGERPTRRL